MLHTIRRGEGPRPILLVHGFLGTGRNLQSLARRLSDADPSLCVTLPDLRGHGASPPLGETDTLDALASDVVEWAQAQGPHRPTLVGHSLGGRVALAALAQASDAFNQVVLLDIGPAKLPSLRGPMQRLFERLMGAPPTAASRAEMRAFFLEGEVEASLTDWVLTNLSVDEHGEVQWRFDRAALARLHWQEGAALLWPVVEQHAPRIWCIAGGRSEFVPPSEQEIFASLGVHVDIIAEAGHFIHVDAVTELVPLLLRKDGPLRREADAGP